MLKIGFVLGALASLGGCSAQQVTLACQMDGVLQPIAAATLGGLIGPQAAAVDNGIIHPSVVAFCAQQGGVAVVGK